MLPGGVAMNIAMALRKLEMPVSLLTYLGKDAPGDALIAEAELRDMAHEHIFRGKYPTDRYMAIEAGGDLFAAIADAHSLEKSEADVIAPLIDGRLGNAKSPWSGQIVLDGNLTEHTLDFIADHTAFSAADIRLAPASPGKALRLRPFLESENASLYVNLIEASALLESNPKSAEDAAKALHRRGLRRAIVTDGGNPCAVAVDGEICTAQPPSVMVKRVTGAGDSFMAAHIAADYKGASAQEALEAACTYAANYISSDGDG